MDKPRSGHSSKVIKKISYQCVYAFQITILSTEATKQQALNYGCLVIDNQTNAVHHYVEKPSSYLSTFINCGVYVCSLEVFAQIATVFHSRDLNYNNGNGHSRDQGYIEWEREVLTILAGTGKLFALPVSEAQYTFSYLWLFHLKLCNFPLDE